jgi:hypothetical protein
MRDLVQKYIGVVRTVTRRFPMAVQQTLRSPGDWFSLALYHDNGVIGTMAMLLRDRERRYFICTASSTGRASRTSECVGANPSLQGAQRVSLEVLQPNAVELYYYSCARINQHNRCRLDSLPGRKYVTTS